MVAQAQAQAQRQLDNRRNPQELLGLIHQVELWAQPLHHGQEPQPRVTVIVEHHRLELHGHRDRVGICRKDQRLKGQQERHGLINEGREVDRRMED